MGRRSFLEDEALRSFIRILAWIILPFAIGLSGLALLNSMPTALVWVAMICLIAFASLRFHDKHNEHEEYDDHPTQEKYQEGLRSYISLVTRKPGETESKQDESK